MTEPSNSAQAASLISVLTREVNQRTLLALLGILVVLLHGISIFWLIQPSKIAKADKPRKLVEVVLLAKPIPKPEPKPIIKPKPEPKPKPVIKPKPVPTAPPKKLPPKLQAGKPPAKAKAPEPVKQAAIKKQPEIHKPVEHRITEMPKMQTPVRKLTEPTRTPPVLSQKSNAHPAPAYAPATSRVGPTAGSSAVGKPAQKTGNAGHDNNGVSSGVVELSQAKPSYPMRAKSRNIEGWVKVEFTVTTSGTVSNAHVVGASPSGIFDAAALDAIQKFRFKPKMVNGKAVSGSATKKFNFTLN